MEIVLLAAAFGGAVMIALIAAGIAETHKAEVTLRDREPSLREAKVRGRR